MKEKEAGILQRIDIPVLLLQGIQGK